MNWNWGRNGEKDENFSEEAATQSWIEDFQEADDGQQQQEEEEKEEKEEKESITQLPHCVGTTFYWLLHRSTSQYKLHVSKNLLCWILVFSKPWQPSSHYWELFASPSTTHSSCKSPLPYRHCSISFVKVFCFPLFIHLSIFAAI